MEAEVDSKMANFFYYFTLIIIIIIIVIVVIITMVLCETSLITHGMYLLPSIDIHVPFVFLQLDCEFCLILTYDKSVDEILARMC